MIYPRRLRTKLRRLFLLRRAHQQHNPSKIHRISLSLCKASDEVNIVKATCDWCLQPFLMPDKIKTIPIASPHDDYRFDIGGFCWSCREFRCHNGSVWVDLLLGEVMMKTWACETCGTPYSADSLEAAAQYAQRMEITKQLFKIISKHAKDPEK